MPPKRITRIEQRTRTRVAVLKAAAKLFLSRGIDATSLDAVAADLGMTKGAVYAHFHSKLELLEAVAAIHSTPMELFAPMLREDLPLVERLRLFGRTLATTTVNRDVVLLDLEYVTYAARNRRWGQKVRASNRAGREDLAARLVEVATRRAEPLPVDGATFVAMLHIVGRGIIQELAMDRDALSPTMAEAMFMLLAGDTAKVTAKSKAGRRPRR